MSVTVAEHTVNGLSDKCVDILGGELTRKMSMGADWTELCIGTYQRIDNAATTVIGEDAYRIGVCHNAEPDINGSSSHWAGLTVDSSSLSYYSSRLYGTLKGVPLVSVGGSQTRGAAVNLYGNFAATSDSRLCPIFVYLKRVAGPALELQYLLPGTDLHYSPYYADWVSALTAGTLASCDALISAATGNTYAWTAISSGMPIDESANGDLDSLSIIWKSLAHTAGFYAFGACKWS